MQLRGYERGRQMGILSKIKSAVGLKKKSRKKAKRRTPPRKKNGEFRKRR
jgi:hypothetical protein